MTKSSSRLRRLLIGEGAGEGGERRDETTAGLALLPPSLLTGV